MVQEIYLNIITFCVYLLVLLAIYVLILALIRRIGNREIGFKHSLRAIRIIMRFLFVLFVLIGIFSIFDLSSTVIVSISSVSGIIIGFAATEVVSQVIAGIYLITTHPFGIHDLIKIGSVEGIVARINLNYTVLKQFDGSMLKIPNKKLIDTKFMNYTIKIEEEIKTKREQLKFDKDIPLKEALKDFVNREKLEKMMGDLKDYVTEKEITRYTFGIQVEMARNPADVIQKLRNLCMQYEALYKYKPKFAITGLGYRANLTFWVVSPNPHLILENQNLFVAAIAEAIYKEEEK